MKKDEFIRIRVTENEKKKILKKAEQCGKTLSEYVRYAALDKSIVVMPGAWEAVAELRRIGNNLNQITVLANMGLIKTVHLNTLAEEVGKVWQSLSSDAARETPQAL
ncbi:MAG: hypothetical protein BWY15_02471 [Firmicutes bacterium ADurb.Bin193]|nr:MAG: hypothetical protein BWY15_02471 [Firmicutes bacterium ADurb.Bin193]